MIKPDVFATIMDFFVSGLPVVNEDAVPRADTGTVSILARDDDFHTVVIFLRLNRTTYRFVRFLFRFFS